MLVHHDDQVTQAGVALIDSADGSGDGARLHVTGGITFGEDEKKAGVMPWELSQSDEVARVSRQHGSIVPLSEIPHRLIS